jgi:HAD superfamily hydrolase (TIGR01549 family)
MKAIIFDFDGVILDSVNVKTDAFREMYTIYGDDVAQRVVDHHVRNGGISRYEKFKYCHKHFLNISLSSTEVDHMASEFSKMVFTKVCNSEYIQGALEFLNYSHEKYLTFICTGTPESEIIQILKSKNLGKYFNAVYGSPKTKGEIIKNIMNDRNLHSEEILFIGDAMTDYNASQETDVNFIGIRNKDTIFPEDVVQIDDLMKIVNIKNL